MLLCLSASHKNAPFDLLGRLADPGPAELRRAVPGARGAVVIATCNRFEAYLDLPDRPAPGADDPVARLSDRIAEHSGIGQDELRETWRTLHAGDAARHLFAVSAGLESVAIGEGEIAGQVRRALERARADGSTSSELERLFQRASQTSRGVKNTTRIGQAGRSIVRLGLDLAEARIASWREARVLLIGTGAYAGASLAALRDRGVTEVAVYSPSGRAAGFAASHQIRPVFAPRFLREVAEATIIVTCTTSPATVLDAERLSAARRALRTALPILSRDGTPGCPVTPDATQLVLDLGLPRNVDPDVAEVPGVELLDLETIRVHAPLEDRHAHEHARVIIERAAQKFAEVAEEQALAPAVVALRQAANRILEAEIARVAPRDPDGVAEHALRHLMARLLHEPTVRARHFARAGEAERYLDALETLHGVRPPGRVAG